MRRQVVGIKDREAGESQMIQGFVKHGKRAGFFHRAMGSHRFSESFLVGNWLHFYNLILILESRFQLARVEASDRWMLQRNK